MHEIFILVVRISKDTQNVKTMADVSEEKHSVLSLIFRSRWGYPNTSKELQQLWYTQWLDFPSNLEKTLTFPKASIERTIAIESRKLKLQFTWFSCIYSTQLWSELLTNTINSLRWFPWKGWMYYPDFYQTWHNYWKPCIGHCKKAIKRWNHCSCFHSRCSLF